VRGTLCFTLTPFSCYGRYANDGFDKYEANSIHEFGRNGRVYITALTTINPGSELFVSYGPDYLADPPRFDTYHYLLNSRSRDRIRRYPY